MKKTMKNHQRSIRMSDFTMTVVEGIHGDGFNRKFENLVYMFAQQERDIEASIKQLRKEEKALVDRIGSLKSIERTLGSVKSYLDSAKRFVDNSPIDGQISL